mmetsp:Transcript_102435/g.293880  ORF Transcript_102435/g.293880 Transcript_102435/m.293880 type:complete len:483 (-) Transcript_102435:55-1503(-)
MSTTIRTCVTVAVSFGLGFSGSLFVTQVISPITMVEPEGGTVPNWPYNLVQQMSERLDVQSSGVESRLGSIETQLQNLHAELSGVKTVPERTDNVVKQLSELLDTKLSGTTARLGSIEAEHQNFRTELSGVDLHKMPKSIDNLAKQIFELLETKTSGIASLLGSIEMEQKNLSAEISAVKAELAGSRVPLGQALSPRAPVVKTAKETLVQSTEDRLTAMVEKSTLRQFESACGRTFTIPDLYSTFSAHAVEWNLMGKTDAWWSVLTDFPRGADIPEDDKRKFYESGKVHIAYVWQTLGGRPFDRSQSVLDFGCGVGRLAFAFADVFGSVACVDQSFYHLRLAEAEWKIRGGQQPAKINFTSSGPDLLSAVNGQRFDFVHSVVVLQHMVSPLQTVYLAQFCDVLKHGGRAWIQIPTKTFADSCDLESSRTAGGMQMHYTPATIISHVIESRGCSAKVIQVGGRYIEGGMSSAVVLVERTGPEF